MAEGVRSPKSSKFIDMARSPRQMVTWVMFLGTFSVLVVEGESRAFEDERRKRKVG